MSFLRSAFTYGAIFYLTGLLFLFFGGLYLSGGEVPPNRPVGWTGHAWSRAIGWMRGVAGASGLPGLWKHLGGLLGSTPGQPEWGGVLLLSTVPFLLAGTAVACWARASWTESAVVLVAVACSLWTLSPGGEGLRWALRQVGWMWEDFLWWHPPTGWGA
ncbi:MAG: hypothetical protein ABEL97_07880 [Salinibacter sp.]